MTSIPKTLTWIAERNANSLIYNCKIWSALKTESRFITHSSANLTWMARRLFIVLTYFTAEIFIHLITGYKPCWLCYIIDTDCVIPLWWPANTVIQDHIWKSWDSPSPALFLQRVHHSTLPKATFPFNWLDSCEVCFCLTVLQTRFQSSDSTKV